MSNLKTLKEIFANPVPNRLYCNVPDVYFIYHGEWSDPEVMYEDKLFNLPMDVETPLWDYYCEDCEERGIKESENGFAHYVENNPDELYEILENLIEAGEYKEVLIMDLNTKEILDKGNEERIKKYPLTFFDVINEIFETGGYYQGEQFKNGYFISLGKSSFSYNQIKLFRYDWNKGACDEDVPVLSKGLIEQRYREVFTKEEIWRGTEDWRHYIELENT